MHGLCLFQFSDNLCKNCPHGEEVVRRRSEMGNIPIVVCPCKKTTCDKKSCKQKLKEFCLKN